MVQSIAYWDVALGATAGYIAVVTLVRLLTYHRDNLLIRFRANFVSERRRHARVAEERKRQEAARRTADRPGTAV
jgi:hypothetical protein